MSEGGETRRWIQRVEAIRESRKARRLFYGVLAFLVLLDVFVEQGHVIIGWDAISGFSAVYGLVSCVLIIVLSKVLGQAWLMKREDYYD